MVTQSMEKMNRKIGIFILNYNGLSWLKQNLNNIIEYSPEAEIIVIDNNSHDQSIKYLNQNFSSIEVIRYTQNYGFSKGYNKTLLTEKRFDYFIIMNNDVQVTKNWIPSLLKTIQKPNTGIVQPKIKNILSNSFDYAGGAGGFIDIFGIPFCRGRIINTLEKDTGQYNDNRDIFWASGCCFMIKKDLFQELNGFDEDLFMHQEEIDLCWRTQKTNQKVHYCSTSTIYHFGGGTLSYNAPQKSYYNHRNSLLILLKNLSWPMIFFIIPCKIIGDHIIIIWYLLHLLCFNKKFITAFFIIKAHIHFLLLSIKFLKKRKTMPNKLIYRHSILLDYFLLKKKKFSDLNNF